MKNKIMKERSINNKVVGDINYGFRIKHIKTLDAKSIPYDIREKYSKTSEYWYEYIKNINNK